MQNGFLVGDSHRVEPSLNSVTGPARTIRVEPKVMQVFVHDPKEFVFLAVDPKWDPFRADPRFRDLLERCNFTRTARTGGP